MRTATILGFPVHNVTSRQCVEEAWNWLQTAGPARYMACANPHALQVALDDAPFARALHEADLVIPDGIGIIIAGRILGERFCERVAGMDFFTAVTARANSKGGYSCFFLGSSEAVLTKIRERMAIDYPNVRIAGTYSPPFKAVFDPADSDAIIAAINGAAPDILWVGMTAPKQEKWIHEHRARLNVKLIGAIGAVFDFFGGTKVRSSDWMCRNGLEWLPRLIREPRRLWRRNFISAPKFMKNVAIQALQPDKSRRE